jgi:hypothetical protein
MEKGDFDYRLYCFFCWVFQTSSWVCVIAIVIYNTFPENEIIERSYFDDEGYKVYVRTSLGSFCFAYFFIGPISYIIYIVLEVQSVTYKYLKDFKPDSTIKSKMDKWISLKPNISIEWDCYHYVTRKVTETDSNGKKHTTTVTEKVSKDYGTYNFNYYSCRDISGKFTLESNSSLKSYVLLNISSSVEFADKETVSDYNKELDRINSFRSKDTHFDLKEIKTIYSLSENQIVLINKCCCCFLNKCIFIFFIIICLAEFYKIFFYCMGSVKYFTVKKAVSTRKDLGDNEYSEKYYMQNPSIESPFGNTLYEPNMFIQILPEYKMNNTNNNNNNNSNSIISFEINDEPKQDKTSNNDNKTPLLNKEYMNE